MVRVTLDAGVPIQELRSTNHQVEVSREGDRRASIALTGGDTIPNKDFVLRYDVVARSQRWRCSRTRVSTRVIQDVLAWATSC